MKILYLHQHFTTPHGAGGTRSYEMARRLAEVGHEVTIVTGSYVGCNTGLNNPFIRGRREGAVDGFRVIEIKVDYSNKYAFLARVSAFLRFAAKTSFVVLREEYEIVIATSTPLTVAIPAMIGRWFRRKTFIFEVRDLWPELPQAMGIIKSPVILWGMGALEWASYRSAHRHIALSKGISDGIVKRGVPRERIAIIPNGSDTSIFFESTENKYRPAGFTDKDLICVFSGTHGNANGLDSLLDAAAELKRRGDSNVKFLLIGDGGLKEHLVARAEHEGLVNVVFWHTISKLELARVLSSSDLGLQILRNVPAFYFGTSPNKFFDYLAAGLPVLNNYPGWLKELIEENDCGWAVPPDNASAFADVLQEAAINRTDLAAKGNRARALAEREFDRDRLGKIWIRHIIGNADSNTSKNTF